MITITIPDDAKPYEVRRLAATLKAYADFPPEGLEMSSGPVTVHSRQELKKRAAEALKVAEGAEVVHVDTPPEPPAEPEPVVLPSPPENVYDVVEEAAQEAAEAVREAAKAETPKPEANEAKQRAKALMLKVTKAGVAVPDLKAKLAEAIPGVDTAHYNEAQYVKACEVMEGLLNA